MGLGWGQGSTGFIMCFSLFTVGLEKAHNKKLKTNFWQYQVDTHPVDCKAISKVTFALVLLCCLPQDLCVFHFFLLIPCLLPPFHHLTGRSEETGTVPSPIISTFCYLRITGDHWPLSI